MTRPAPRSGRRPGDSGSREAILTAAREGFAASGYAGTSIRGIARTAGVDAALVHHFFGTKEGLFAAAMAVPVDPAVLVAHVLDGPIRSLGERLLRTLLGVWDAAPNRAPMLALVRSAVDHEESARLLREFLSDAVLGPVARHAGGDRPELRASLVASQMVGLVMTRYVLRLDPLASAPAPDIVTAVAPNVQRYLTGKL